MAVSIKESSAIREAYVADLFKIFSEKGEDVAMITSGSFNFPVTFDGKEAFVEVVVKVPKCEDDECYAKREEYQLKLKENARKAEEAKAKKAKRRKPMLSVEPKQRRSVNALHR